MEFIKMHGLGNDFVFLDHFQNTREWDYPALARRLCDRHFGVGGDGLIVVRPSAAADAQMRIFNRDGSEAEMCGNGIRCFARYMYDQGYPPTPSLRIETLAGVLKVRLEFEEDRFQGATVDMGEPIFAPALIPVQAEREPVVAAELTVAGERFYYTALSMGNPHCVIFVDDLECLDVAGLGSRIEKHPLFPRHTNVEFVWVKGPQELTVKVWERGAGATLACGTGACAVVVGAALAGKSDRKATVHLPGGDLAIEWAEDNHVYMTGPAAYVFTGDYIDCE
ncbi:MAG: diaminopimelate epimerase [Peptococcaceae bacterium]|jgi:diaminopimelate epimerase|nr:diaminopimelate epimerase [Peptococcaceae bacterium]